jgi:MFS family permease
MPQALPLIQPFRTAVKVSATQVSRIQCRHAISAPLGFVADGTTDAFVGGRRVLGRDGSTLLIEAASRVRGDGLWGAVYAPSFLMAISQQALVLLIPLYVLELGGGPAFAAIVVGLRGLGVLAFDVPAGMLIARFGEKPVLLGGLLAVLLALLALAFTEALWLFALTAVPLGAGSTAWLLGRQSYVTDVSANDEFGKRIAFMAGLQRMGGFVGPAAGGVVATTYGYPAAFIGGAVCAAVAGVLVIVYTRVTVQTTAEADLGLNGLVRVVRQYARVFATAGFVALSMQLMRACRQLLLPLYGVFLGLDAAAIGLIYSMSAAIDMSLFYPVGVVVDRYGRKWSAVPSMVLFVLGFVALSYATGFASLMTAGLLLGLANGVSTGIIMIIGSDLAPASQQGQFLGVWRLIGDVGMSGGPIVVGMLAEVASLAFASLAVAGIGVVGVVLVGWYVPETLRRLKAESEA